MLATNGNILVRVNLSQNEDAIIGGNKLKTGSRYNENFREKNPVVAEVLDGLGEIKTGSCIVCNYNYFDEDSPLQLSDDTYSIPVDEEIFAIINDDGTLKPVQGNVLVERISKDSPLPLPEELKKPHANQGVVMSNSEGYFKGQYIFWLPYADYVIQYTWNDEVRTGIKIHKSEITGYLKI